MRPLLPLALALLAASSLVAQDQAWLDQVQQVRIELARAGPVAMLEALHSGDDLRVFAALSMEYAERIRYEDSDLVEVLKKTSHREVAKGAALLLSRHGTPTATRALVEHVGSRGVADDVALDLLRRPTQGRDKADLMKIAGNPSDKPADLEAIRGLAGFEGRDVTIALYRLQGDWSEPVQKAAADALVLRARLGLDTEQPYRAPAVGKRPEEVAYVVGSENDPDYVPPPPTTKPEEHENEVATDDLLAKARAARARAAEIARQNAR